MITNLVCSYYTHVRFCQPTNFFNGPGLGGTPLFPHMFEILKPAGFIYNSFSFALYYTNKMLKRR